MSSNSNSNSNNSSSNSSSNSNSNSNNNNSNSNSNIIERWSCTQRSTAVDPSPLLSNTITPGVECLVLGPPVQDTVQKRATKMIKRLEHLTY